MLLTRFCGVIVMPEQDKARPFAVGDFMVIKIGGHKTFVEKVSEINYPIIFTQKDGFSSHGYHEEYITAIRSERKGCKEARDIVAMLAKAYLRWTRLRKEVECDGGEESEYKRGARIRSMRSYHKAKAMLGANHD